MPGLNPANAWRVGALAGLTLAAWLGVAAGHWQLPLAWSADICRVEPGVPWSGREFLETAGMWLVMMVAMMTPTILPWILALNRGPAGGNTSAGGFLGGYFLAWGLFSVLASLLQWQLASRALLTPDLVIADARLAGGLLLLVGAYQWSPLKDACLKKCESPVSFFLAHWRDGPRGALAMGFRHGLHCIGCCWLLMAAMLLVGAMNLFWMGAASLYVLLEMYLPAWRTISRGLGGVAVLAGLDLLWPW